jgi:hypothetical protein
MGVKRVRESISNLLYAPEHGGSEDHLMTWKYVTHYSKTQQCRVHSCLLCVAWTWNTTHTLCWVHTADYKRTVIDGENTQQKFLHGKMTRKQTGGHGKDREKHTTKRRHTIVLFDMWPQWSGPDGAVTMISVCRVSCSWYTAKSTRV